MLTSRWDSIPFGLSGWLSAEALPKKVARLEMKKKATAAKANPPKALPTIAPTFIRVVLPMLEGGEEFVEGEGKGKNEDEPEGEEEFVEGEGKGENEGEGEGSLRARRYVVGSLARDCSSIYRVRELA